MMKTRDLLVFRGVSREWRDFSTEILLKRKTFQVELRRDLYSAGFNVFRNSNSRETRFLTELTPFLTTSKTFPCTYFIFNGNLKSAEFLSQVGSRVKGLKLIGPQNLNCIRKLLVEQIPHVESLELEGFEAERVCFINLSNFFGPQVAGARAPQIPPTIFPQDSQFQLSSLTSLKLGEGNSAALVKEILNAAPKLRECSGIRSAEEIGILHPRIHIVKGLELKPGPDCYGQITIGKCLSMMRILQQLLATAASQLHLTSLAFNYSSVGHASGYQEIGPGLRNTLSRILTLSQSSLRKLKFAPHPKFHSLIEWPILEYVEELTLEGDLVATFVQLFPCDQVSKIFPKIHTIHLKDVKRMTEEDVLILKQHLPIPAVKSLLVTRPTAQMMKIFVPLFINATQLFLDSGSDSRERTLPNSGVEPFSNYAPVIWQMMKGLKSLQIKFPIDCPTVEIDAGFTGMEKKTCQLIRTLGGDEFTIEDIEKFRVNPSILNLTELEELFLPGGFTEDENPKYKDFNFDDHQEMELMRASFISFKYAFKLLPKLLVYPQADH